MCVFVYLLLRAVRVLFDITVTSNSAVCLYRSRTRTHPGSTVFAAILSLMLGVFVVLAFPCLLLLRRCTRRCGLQYAILSVQRHFTHDCAIALGFFQQCFLFFFLVFVAAAPAASDADDMDSAAHNYRTLAESRDDFDLRRDLMSSQDFDLRVSVVSSAAPLTRTCASRALHRTTH